MSMQLQTMLCHKYIYGMVSVSVNSKRNFCIALGLDPSLPTPLKNYGCVPASISIKTANSTRLLLHIVALLIATSHTLSYTSRYLKIKNIFTRSHGVQMQITGSSKTLIPKTTSPHIVIKRVHKKIKLIIIQYICHTVRPLVDPFRSHVPRSLFKGLP